MSEEWIRGRFPPFPCRLRLFSRSARKQLCVGCNDGTVFLVELNDLHNPEVVVLTKPGMNSEITQYV